MGWMFLPLRRYADFCGRSRRKEYWLFSLLIVLLLTVPYIPLIALLSDTTSPGSPAAAIGSLAIVLIALLLFVPSLAVQVRRFHDQDRSGWMVLLNFVPVVGGIIVLVFMCMEGTRGPNRYGADPKAGEGGVMA